MNLDAIDLRIEEVEHEISQLKLKRAEIEDKIKRKRGVMEELFNWRERELQAGDYGKFKLDGSVRIMKVPEFGSIEKAIEKMANSKVAIGGENLEETKAARKSRAMEDAREAAQILSDLNNQENEDDGPA